ncbi:hypothetical protein ACDA63_06635 [Uliginosibacterium sp. sgz301328]|uniref:hypothetical protein n=1 Tax=Uliginosibacterium sp. sgz301328 TaxID=3243764 RepID=UPI00359E8451
MEMKGNFKVLGAKKFKGEVEGSHFDNTKLYVVMEVSERNGSEVGYNAAVLPFGKSDEFEKIKGLPFPLDCELTISMTTKGYEVLGLRALPAPGQAKAA